MTLSFQSRPMWAMLAAAALATIWGWWWFQPDRSLERAWRGVIAAAEARHARAFGGHFAEDYGDRWGYTRSTVTTDARLAFAQLQELTVRTEELRIRRDGDTGSVSAIIRVEFRAPQMHGESRAAINSLFTPFEFHWRREPDFPWEWKIVRIDQPEFEPRRLRAGW